MGTKCLSRWRWKKKFSIKKLLSINVKKKKKCFQGFSIAVFCLVEINRRDMYEVPIIRYVRSTFDSSSGFADRQFGWRVRLDVCCFIKSISKRILPFRLRFPRDVAVFFFWIILSIIFRLESSSQTIRFQD